MFTSHSFYQKFTLPSRLPNTHGILIHNFVCKLSETTLDTTTGILIKMFSDFILLKNIKHRDQEPKYVTICKHDTKSIQNFQQEILNSLEHINLINDYHIDPNQNYNVLHKIIQQAKIKHIPDKLLKFNKSKPKMSPWITKGIIRSIQYRDNL